jgi:hypothetical protein
MSMPPPSFLKQGSEAQKLMAQYDQNRFPYLQVTSAPFLTSITESMRGEESTQARMQRNINAEVTESERAFNQALTRYSALNQIFMDSLLQQDDPAKIMQLRAELTEVNFELITLAKRINEDMDDIPILDEKSRQQIKQQQASLGDYIDELQKDKKRIKKAHIELANIGAQSEDAALQYKSIHLQYIVWIFLSITVVSFTLNILFNENAQAISGIIIILLLLIIYVVAKAASP